MYITIYTHQSQWQKFISSSGGAKLREFPTNLFWFFIVFCFLLNVDQHKNGQNDLHNISYKIIKSTFSTYEVSHAPVVFSISFCIFNCFENSDRAENFRQTVAIYGRWGGGRPPTPPEFPPLIKAARFSNKISHIVVKPTWPCSLLDKALN